MTVNMAIARLGLYLEHVPNATRLSLPAVLDYVAEKREEQQEAEMAPSELPGYQPKVSDVRNTVALGAFNATLKIESKGSDAVYDD